MARGTNPVDDPRWAGLDSQSLPDRPAHPDPSRVAEHGDPAETPSHGIFGHLDAKHGIADEGEVKASLAANATAQARSLEAERDGVQARADAGDENAKRRLKQIDQSLKAAQRDADGEPDPLPGANAVARATLAGDIVPSIENASAVEGEGEGDGKRDDALAQNALGAEKG